MIEMIAVAFFAMGFGCGGVLGCWLVRKTIKPRIEEYERRLEEFERRLIGYAAAESANEKGEEKL